MKEDCSKCHDRGWRYMPGTSADDHLIELCDCPAADVRRAKTTTAPIQHPNCRSAPVPFMTDATPPWHELTETEEAALDAAWARALGWVK